MKPVVLYLQKKNLIIGLLLAFLLVLFLFFIKRRQTQESFITLDTINALCNKTYEPKLTAPPTITRKAPVAPVITKKIPNTIPIITSAKKQQKFCKFGIDIEPPTEEVKKAAVDLFTISPEIIANTTEMLKAVPEFVNILTSSERDNIIKELIIVESLLNAPPPDLTDDEVQHIVKIILSEINMIDPQIASNAAAFYSKMETNLAENPFNQLNMPIVKEKELNIESVNTVLSAPVKELSDESANAIGALLSDPSFKVFMPFDECVAILTKNIRKNDTNTTIPVK